MLAVVLVGLTLGATALAEPLRAVRERGAAKEPSFVERVLSLFRLDDHEERRSPQGNKAQGSSMVTGSGIRPHQTSLRFIEATQLE